MNLRDFALGKAAGGGGGSATLINKNISANGTYNASADSADGYKKVVVDVPSVTPTGNINITSTAQTDVSAYATAQVVDADLVAGNIKKDVDILGVVGTYEGGGGGGDATLIAVLENSLTDLTIPDGTTILSRNCLEYRTKLENVIIPSSVKELGQRVFQNCSSLRSVTILAQEPPTAGGAIFQSATSKLTIYVPADSVEAYKAATNWSTYATYIQPIP